ncbi:MAG TPA: hypothetical protein VFG59_10320 [Anaeromyxobacter sp.]|nr:hypothetical protein [Anaeromyxobacter sp.]
MRKLLVVALPLGLVLVAGALLARTLRSRDQTAEARLERQRLKREFDERAALLRVLPADAAEWRGEANALLRDYFQAASEIRNRFPEVPPSPTALEAAQAERRGKLAEKDRLAIEDFQAYADSRLALLKGGYAPAASAVGAGLRLDLLAIEPGPSPAGAPGLRIDFALWGAPRLLERERSGQHTVSRTVVPLVLKALRFQFQDAKGGTYGEMSGPGDPYQKLVDPERFAPDFPPGILFGTWWVELLPREAATMDLQLELEVHHPSGSSFPGGLSLRLPVSDSWRIPPGTSYQAEIREAAPGGK